MGAWEPAASRFPDPHGIHEVLDRIRDRGMIPGLWLEPEVAGVRSPTAGALPDEALFRREGVRVREHGRFHLDLRRPAARAHLGPAHRRPRPALPTAPSAVLLTLTPGPDPD